MDENALARLAWDQLVQMRARTSDPAEQARLAPFEHRAYAREAVAQNPMMALPYLAMVPGYQALKLMGAGARTKPGLEQLMQGYAGIGDGLKEAFRGRRT